MVIEETARMICKTDMNIVDGFPVPPQSRTGEINILDILNLKASTGLEYGFVFYDKKTEEQICQIHFENKRREFEISYGTAREYWNKGYMKEALHFFIEWIFRNTQIDALYGLINNNSKSQHIIETEGFTFDEEIIGEGTWFVKRR